MVKDQDLKEYRCTRNKPYAHGCIGHDDISARQGYYIEASCALDAYGKMCADYPEDVDDGFTIEIYSNGPRRLITFKEEGE